MNLAFINVYKSWKIILVILLLYFTHQLQLLNVGIFLFFIIAYFNQIDQVI